MKKDPSIFLFHILESIEAVESFTKGLDFESFRKNQKTNFATIRALEIIGEAVKNMPKDFRNKYKGIAWKKIAGTRDKLIHEYFGIDLKLAFKIIQQDIPVLKEKVLEILEELKLKKLL